MLAPVAPAAVESVAAEPAGLHWGKIRQGQVARENTGTSHHFAPVAAVSANAALVDEGRLGAEYKPGHKYGVQTVQILRQNLLNSWAVWEKPTHSIHQFHHIIWGKYCTESIYNHVPHLVFQISRAFNQTCLLETSSGRTKGSLHQKSARLHAMALFKQVFALIDVSHCWLTCWTNFNKLFGALCVGRLQRGNEPARRVAKAFLPQYKQLPPLARPSL